MISGGTPVPEFTLKRGDGSDFTRADLEDALAGVLDEARPLAWSTRPGFPYVCARSFPTQTIAR